MVIAELERYGQFVADVTGGAVIFLSVRQTTTSPLNAFQVKFETGNDALMSKPDAEPGNAAYYENVGRTKAWSTRFCTPELSAIMRRNKIDTVSGNLTDSTGDTQSMAIC
jgi:hypothetical protein